MLGWTLENLAHEAGLSTHYLSNLENDQRDPSLSTIVSVAKALGAEPGELLGIPGQTPAGLEAAKVFVALPEEAQTTVLRLMRLLAKKRR